MEQNSSWEANSSSASQEIRRVVRNPHLQEPATCPILSHINPVHALPSHFLKTHLNFSHERLGLPSQLSPWGLLTKTLYTPVPIHATWPAHLILIDFITWIIFGEEYRSYSFWWGVQIIQLLVRSRDHTAPRYVSFSTHLPPRPS
jgi:hypothetical protein